MIVWKGSQYTNCDMCNVSSKVSPILLHPRMFIFGKKNIELEHQGKFLCCDCLHDELMILGAEEDEEK